MIHPLLQDRPLIEIINYLDLSKARITHLLEFDHIYLELGEFQIRTQRGPNVYIVVDSVIIDAEETND